MSSEKNKALVQKVVKEIWNAKNFGLVDGIFAAGMVAHDLPTSIPPTREGFKMVVTAMCNAFPDVKLTVLETTSEDDKVTVRWEAVGTHQGAFMGIPPTNKKGMWGGTTVYRIAANKIVEWWNQSTFSTMLKQLQKS
jgi:predicted ester cyclase